MADYNLLAELAGYRAELERYEQRCAGVREQITRVEGEIRAREPAGGAPAGDAVHEVETAEGPDASSKITARRTRK
jgi:hypothetical protein